MNFGAKVLHALLINIPNGLSCIHSMMVDIISHFCLLLLYWQIWMPKKAFFWQKEKSSILTDDAFAQVHVEIQ